MDGTDMQTPGDAAARYSFLFPIGESRRFKPSHPTIRAMCVNRTLSLASPPRRPRDLLPHSAPSGRCCSRSAVPPSGSASFSTEEPAPTHQPALSCFPSVRLQPLPRGLPSWTPYSIWAITFPKTSPPHSISVSSRVCGVSHRTGRWRGCDLAPFSSCAAVHPASVDHVLRSHDSVSHMLTVDIKP
jgi:hypothetical protein